MAVLSRILCLAALVALAPSVASAWEPIEQDEPYSISGTTGPGLYASIDERGPQAGIGRAIAFTNFKLTWRRDYQPQPDGACTLVTAVPRLIISYVLPKPSRKLPEPVATNWNTFIDGVRRHEKVHGEMIVDMVKEIEAYTVGLSVPDDPSCQKIRAQMTERLSQISQARQQRSRDFDRVELTDGGAVHQLVLNLVNGG